MDDKRLASLIEAAALKANPEARFIAEVEELKSMAEKMAKTMQSVAAQVEKQDGWAGTASFITAPLSGSARSLLQISKNMDRSIEMIKLAAQRASTRR